MIHEVGKQGEIFEAFKEVFCEAMTEGVGIDDGGIDAVFLGKQFELLCYAASGNSFSETIQKEISGIDSLFLKSVHSFGA